MTYSLRRADPGVKWLVTSLLATFGLAYLFGGWMVGLYSGSRCSGHVRLPPDGDDYDDAASDYGS